MNLLPARTAVETGAVPYGLQTLYKWHHLKKNPALIFKVGGRLMIDLDEYREMAVRSRDANVKAAEAVRAVSYDE